MKPSKKPSHEVFVVSQSGYWTKVGAAWPAKDEGLSVQLTTLPLDGRLVIRKVTDAAPADREVGQ